MQNEHIICFAKDWSEEPTSVNHVMTALAKDNLVLWLNSVSMRKPNLGSPRDVRKIFRKILGFFRGAVHIRDNLWVFTPIVIPRPHSKWAMSINKVLMGMSLRILRHRLGIKRFQLWAFVPHVNDYIKRLDPSLIVYYCVDEWSQFTYLDGKRIAACEKELCENSDIVFATAESLVASKRAWNPEIYLSRHGVDHPLFATALKSETKIPDDVAQIPGPIVGFYGTLQDWVDLDLLAYLASRNPNWSIVLIGKEMVDLSRIKSFKNVHCLGVRKHAALPNYCKSFNVGIIPYVINERILHVNPIKLREYLCAGLPVVSVAIPEADVYPEFCAVARDYQAFEDCVKDALKSDSPALRQQRSDAMRFETWENRVAILGEHVMRIKEGKCRKIA